MLVTASILYYTSMIKEGPDMQTIRPWIQRGKFLRASGAEIPLGSIRRASGRENDSRQPENSGAAEKMIRGGIGNQPPPCW